MSSSSSFRPTQVSAPGKLILTGEHSVVYGKVALAASLNLRTSLSVTPSADGMVTLKLPDLELSESWPVSKIVELHGVDSPCTRDPRPPSADKLNAIILLGDLKQDLDSKSLAIVAFLHLLTAIASDSNSITGVVVEVDSQLPIGAGLGSSAAYSVCLAAGLLDSFSVIGSDPSTEWTDTDKSLVNDWAFQAEKVIHGTPSGIDNCVSTFGGALRFVKGKSTDPLNQVPKLQILLVNTKVPRSTKKLVAGVRERRDKFPDMMDSILAGMDSLSCSMEKVLEDLYNAETHDGDKIAQASRLEELIEINQALLNSIGVGHAALDQVCRIASNYGATAKLTGAGGGGCAFILLPLEASAFNDEAMKKELNDLGFEIWSTVVGSAGVSKH